MLKQTTLTIPPKAATKTAAEQLDSYLNPCANVGTILLIFVM